MNFWHAIIESNTFNFAILVLIFVILAQKLNLKSLLETLRVNIVNAIENAKSERKKADEKLKKAKKSVKNLDAEIKQTLDDASVRADGLSEEIIKSAKEQVKLIEQNVKKVVTSEEKTLSAKLTSNALNSACELAKERITKMLKENPKLHDKFIEESTGEL